MAAVRTLMIFHFPNHDTLRLALTSGAIPAAVSTRPARALIEGGIWAEPSAKVPATMLAELHRLGVMPRRSAPAALGLSVLCWPQLLPLQQAPLTETPDHRLPVLFDLPEALLPEVVAEILRLGNDRQSFCHLVHEATARVLLRVIGPPYYALLRALDQHDPHGPHAYIERAPRVWVELGWTHPLAEQIQPPTGSQLFLRPPHEWNLYPEGKFRDIYEVLEFTLAQQPVAWKPAGLPARMTVPLRLARADASEAAELWVLHQDGPAQLDELVRHADDALLARLAFAVGIQDEVQTIVLRARPTRQPPPVLVMRGTAYRSYLRLPNLFVPCGKRLHPPLRREAVHRLLSPDATRVTWLDPGTDGRFRPESLPDSAFQPLAQWVDYILDQEHEALTAWMGATRFEFEPFVCKDEQAPARPRPTPPGSQQQIQPNTPPSSATPEQPATQPAELIQVEEDASSEVFTEMTPSMLEQRLRDVECRFLELPGGPDAPERHALWHELAHLHTTLQHGNDLTICWANAVWETEAPPAWYWAWFQAERTDHDDGELSAATVDRLLKNHGTAADSARMLATYLSWAVAADRPLPDLRSRFGNIMQFLESHEAFLPVRVAWLGWHALARLAAGDALTLARARDRLLQRLYHQGLRPDLDLPGFLRFAGGAAGERFALVRDCLSKLRGSIGAWIDKDMLGGSPTRAYADLLFAFGLACLRENAASQQLLLEAIDGLGQRDEVHTWLLDAYEYRITQALEGRALTGPLPAALLDRLQTMDRTAREVARDQPELATHFKLQRYKIDRLREHSRILEPHERIDPYRHWRGPHDDEVSCVLAALPDIHDRAELLQRLTDLLQKHSKKQSRAPEARILLAALALAPRLGESFARELFERVPAVLDVLERPVDRALLLEKALFLAAHFDEAAWVHTLVARFHQVLDAAHGPELLGAIETLLGEAFRGLRKLGMRDETSKLLERLADLVLQGRSLRAAHGKLADKEWARLLKVLLHVAAGWFYFGQGERAWPVLDEVRHLLFKGSLIPVEQTALACAYARVLGQAPAPEALPRLEELFRNVDRVQDAFTTNTHYSLSRLDLIEAAVLALVHEDFLADGGSRRWLDDDEFLVRRRIHRDMRAALGTE